MRLSRILLDDVVTAAFYDDTGETVRIWPLAAAAIQADIALPQASLDELLPFLPHGEHHELAKRIAAWIAAEPDTASKMDAASQAQLLHPIARPPKLLLLAGNYAKHIEEGGEKAAERAETFPYVFMKPPTTTLTAPNGPVSIPRISPEGIDWELELAVVIGRGGKHISASDALQHVAGYTVINDISDRRFRPNPQRKERPRDKFFDWLHGKWHDSFCPCGPCIACSEQIPDPQSLQMELRVNDQIKQSASTAQQIFSVAEVIAFISDLMTLEPGDIISTGTSAGVGNTTGDFLQPGDQIVARIEGIGVLSTPVTAEAD